MTGRHLDDALRDQRILAGFKRLDKNSIPIKNQDELDLLAGKILSELAQPFDKKIKLNNKNLFINVYLGLLNKIPNFLEKFKSFQYSELKILEAFSLSNATIYKDMSIEAILTSCDFLQQVGFSQADLDAHYLLKVDRFCRAKLI